MIENLEKSEIQQIESIKLINQACQILLDGDATIQLTMQVVQGSQPGKIVPIPMGPFNELFGQLVIPNPVPGSHHMIMQCGIGQDEAIEQLGIFEREYTKTLNEIRNEIKSLKK